MSRVRILNLPNDATEKELREHFTKHVPATAPPLEITDVMIKRLPVEDDAGGVAGSSSGSNSSSITVGSRGGREGRGRGGRTTAAGSTTPLIPDPSPRGGHPSTSRQRLGKIRMAFVGFKSSAAGHFVVGYYNHTYFRSSKIKVEPAKGLNEVGVTLNMKKRQEKQQQQQQEQQQEGEKEPEEEKGPTHRPHRHTADGESGALKKNVKRPAQEDDDEAETDPSDVVARKKTRKELFVEERAQATAGPSWAAEVLVPLASRRHADGGGSGEGEDAGEGGGVHARDESDEAEEERERVALAKQQTLGQVSDLDFLSGLGGGSGGHAGGGHEREKREEEEEEEEEEENEEEEAHREGGEGEGATRQRHAETEEAADAPEATARLSRRVRIGNIPYTATEDHVKQFAASLVGPVEEVHIPLTKDTRQSKGAAFVKFCAGEDAVRALTLCRGAILMGRLLRVAAAEEDPHSKRALERDARQATTAGGVGGGGLAGSSEFKIRKEKERRAEATSGGGAGGTAGAGVGGAPHVAWNTMYMNASAAVDNVAQRLGVKAEDLVSVQAKGAAVRAAIAEAYLTSEIQQVLSDEGVAFEVLESGQQSLLKPRSNTTILVKNLQLAGPAEATELSKMFLRFGTLETSVFPSSGTFALFRFVHPQDARTAFTRLSYKLFKNAPLFLEWAPVGAIVEDDSGEGGGGSGGVTTTPHTSTAAGEGGFDDDEEGDGKAMRAASSVTYTVFVTNIPFTATEDDFRAFLLDSCPRLAKSPDTLIKRLAFQQQQGRAYLTLADTATYHYCLGRLNGKSFEGRTLSCVASKQTEMGAAAAARGGAVAALSMARPSTGGEEVDDDEDPHLRKTAAAVATATGSGAGVSSSSSSSNNRVPAGADPYKIIVKNVPFEATEADIRELFAAFSEIKSVRLPKKTNNFTKHRENNHRGFAFVEFLSATEAARAMDVLRATHLYGRHLVLQYAKLDN